MSKKYYVVLLTAIASLACTNAVASNDQRVHPQKGDPSLYSSFCFFVEDFSTWLEARWTAEPARKEALAESAARYLKVESADLPRVLATCRSVSAALRAINVEAHDYVHGLIANGDTPDVDKMDEFERQRQATIKAGLDELRRNMSRTSWEGMNAHINGTHRTSIVESRALSQPQ